ncbi:hypothetical protein HYE67_006625 [Fusarium culmorum]|uniref:JmjC domain-containing protein n=1 Tax=Fusarium culmorum TaxID=5516 RepID=A0A2T4H0W6_FUSCU|nr:hypothetical protein FCULG_00007635 [Fusarium culmorum]QPC64394.1 hypothetical protein HYE67_006625 [Fusarium culmorum]
MTPDDFSNLISKLPRNPDKRLATLRRVRDIALSQQNNDQQQIRSVAQWNRFHNFFDAASELYREKVTSLVTSGRAETEDDQAWARFLCLAAGTTSLNVLSDSHWRREVIHETDAWLRDNPDATTHRHNAALDTLSILKYATLPSPEEAIFCSARRAKTLVDAGTVLVLRDQQKFAWGGQPIEGFFKNHVAYWPEDDKKIRVTILDLPADGPLTRRKTVQQVTEKILHGSPANQRWNILDLKNTADVPHPEFLGTPNCALLHCFPLDIDRKGNRLVRTQTMKFILLSEGGNHTPMHVDSHGLATFITVQQGEIGFGWIAHETPQDRLDIHKEQIPDSLKRKARYLVLRPGQTVYMPSGTIHFIFRRENIPTMATGGHVLTWKSIPKWLSIMKMQELSQEAVDDDVTTDSARAYIDILNKIVRQDRDIPDSERRVIRSIINNWDTITEEDLLNDQQS